MIGLVIGILCAILVVVICLRWKIDNGIEDNED